MEHIRWVPADVQTVSPQGRCPGQRKPHTGVYFYLLLPRVPRDHGRKDSQ